MLEAAFARYQRLIFDQPTRVSRGKLVEPQFLFEDDNTDSVEEKYGATGLQDDGLWLKTLFVKILDSSSPFSDEMKREDADESYEITIDDDIAIVTAATVWGALYGLDTFSQLVQREDPMSGYIVRGLPLYISDSPRYPWRGELAVRGGYSCAVYAVCCLYVLVFSFRYPLGHIKSLPRAQYHTSLDRCNVCSEIECPSLAYHGLIFVSLFLQEIP